MPVIFRRPPVSVLARGLAVTAVFGAYLVRVDVGPVEALVVCVGALLLWGPLALGVDHVARREVADGAVRLAIAFSASYAATAASYYLWSMAGAPLAFYLLQAGVVATVVVLRRRHRLTGGRGAGLARARVNWLLLGLIAIALFTTAPYTKLANLTTAGSRNLRVPADSLYFVSQTYELDRHTPPLQEPTRAGTPPRAYHPLAHVTALLLARTTRQPDFLRAQLVYHLSILTVATSLVLYALGKVLAGRRLGGYVLVALLYPLAVVGKPLLTDTTLTGFFIQFYFTYSPQLSSMLDPVALGGWQSYSAVLVALGLLLAVAVASIRLHEGKSAGTLLIVGAGLVACLSRFRIQVFLVALPAFLFVVVVAFLRGRRRAAVASFVTLMVGSLPLVLEATSSHYRPASAGLSLGYNGLTAPNLYIGRIRPALIFDTWPFSQAVYETLFRWLSGGALRWTWHIVSLTAFVLLNVVGVLGTAAAIHYFTRRAAWRRLQLVSILVLAMTVGSLLVGWFVTGFDSYSLAGQALFLPAWYMFPLAAVALTAVFGVVSRRLRLPEIAWISLGLAVVVTGAALRETGPPSKLAAALYAQHVREGDEISNDRWLMLQRLRTATPKDAVIISSEYVFYRVFFSGIAGRAGYTEAAGDVNDDEAQRIYGDDRRGVIGELWTTEDEERFCTLLRSTPSTHLVEFSIFRLRVQAPLCLERDWVSPESRATIWKIT